MNDGTYLQTIIKDEPPTQHRLLQGREVVFFFLFFFLFSEETIGKEE